MYICQFSGGNFINLLLYVDDTLIIGRDANLISKLKDELPKSFNMRQILGKGNTRDQKNNKLWLSHEKYLERVLEKFNMKHSKPTNTPLATNFKLSKRYCL